MKCDAADSSEGAKGTPREDEEEICCSRDPCHKLGGPRWREGMGHTAPQTLGAVLPGLLPHRSPMQPDMQRPDKGFTGEECIAIFTIHFGNGLPGVYCAHDRAHGSAELAAKLARGALGSWMSCLQGPRWRNSA